MNRIRKLFALLCLGMGAATMIACSSSTSAPFSVPQPSEGATVAASTTPSPITAPGPIATEPSQVRTPSTPGEIPSTRRLDDAESLLDAAADILEHLSAVPNGPRRSIANFVRNIEEVAKAMTDTGDTGYLPVLVQMQRMQLFFSGQLTIGPYLTSLSGEEESVARAGDNDPNWWVEWLSNHPEVNPPQSYAAWMGRLFYHIDPRMGAFFYDGVKNRIRLEEIVWGGVVKDKIPDLTNPPVVAADQAAYLNPTDRVFGVSINGEHRAYPLRILNPHEMANDVVGGVPFALAY